MGRGQRLSWVRDTRRGEEHVLISNHLSSSSFCSSVVPKRSLMEMNANFSGSLLTKGHFVQRERDREEEKGRDEDVTQWFLSSISHAKEDKRMC